LHVGTAQAQDSEYVDRQRAAAAQSEVDATQQRAQAIVGYQQRLKNQIDIFASQHGGYADAGKCGSDTITTCAFFGFCVPKAQANIPVTALATGVADDIQQCQVTFGDQLACELSQERTWSYVGDKRGKMITLVANCYDPQHHYQSLFQYANIPGGRSSSRHHRGM
jgi:hypothetical protein